MKAICKCFLTNSAVVLFVLCFLQSGFAAESAVEQQSVAESTSEGRSCDPPPEISVLDSMVNLYEAVEFDHSMHMDMTECSTCHHHMIDQESQASCYLCHREWFPGAEDQMRCRDCHVSERWTAEYIDKVETGIMNHHDHRGLMGAFHNQCLGCHRENGIGGCQDCHARREAGDAFFQANAGSAGGKSKSSGNGH